MNKITYSLLMVSTCTAISGCMISDIYGPGAYPRGYAHLQKEYKTIIPDRPFFIGDSYTDEEVVRSEELWTSGINSLLNELESNAVMNGLSVSVQPAEPETGYDVRMDYYLRKALKERGYLIVTEPIESVPVIKYVARLPGYHEGLQEKGRVVDNIDPIQDQTDLVKYQNKIGEPYVFMGLEVYDLSAPKNDQLLLSVETLQTVLDKDLREIRGYPFELPKVYGIKPTSNIYK